MTIDLYTSTGENHLFYIGNSKKDMEDVRKKILNLRSESFLHTQVPLPL